MKNKWTACEYGACKCQFKIELYHNYSNVIIMRKMTEATYIIDIIVAMYI